MLARQVRRASQAAQAGDAAAFPELWREAQRRFAVELEPHFRAEETALLPRLEAAGEAALVARTRSEHALLRDLIASGPLPANALFFGAMLHEHVRFEERSLFPRAERVLTPEALEAVGRAAREARRARP